MADSDSDLSLPAILHRRSLGLLSPHRLRHLLLDRRVRLLRPSPLRDVDATAHTAAITDLSLETTERRYLLAGAFDGSFYIHDLAGVGRGARFESQVVAHVGRSHAGVHKSSVECVQWYPADSGVFVTSGADGVVKVWDANRLTARPADEFSFDGKVHCHHMSEVASSHQLVAVATSVNHVHLVDLRTGANAHELRGGHSDAVVTCRWSNRRESLLATGGAEGRVLVWDVRQGRSCLRSLDYNDLLAKRRNDGRRRRNDEKKEGVSHDGAVVGLRFSGDGLHLFSLGGGDRKLRRWCMETGCNTKARLPLLQAQQRKRQCVHFAVTSNFAFVPSSASVQVLDVADDAAVGSLDGHFNGVTCCLFNELAQELYSGGMDRNVIVWEGNVEQGRRCEEEEGGGEGQRNKAGRLREVVTVDAWSSSDDEDGT